MLYLCLFLQPLVDNKNSSVKLKLIAGDSGSCDRDDNEHPCSSHAGFAQVEPFHIGEQPLLHPINASW